MTTTQAQLDRPTFEAAAERHRRELHVHCYRMLGSFSESEDLVQETFLRAWRARETFRADSSLRAWLYKIATNACLDALDKRPRQPTPAGEILWLEPYPDQLLEELDPAELVAARESIQLTYVVAIQHLPPLQRAALILRDILDLSAKETAGQLETSVAAVNSALQRARATMRERLPEHGPSASASADERRLVELITRYCEDPDPQAIKALLAVNARFSMPPQSGVYIGRDTIVDSWVEGGFGSETFGSLRILETRANGCPALANYHHKPGVDGWLPLALDLLRIDNDEIAEIVTFDGTVFSWFGLPERL
jgi:RNA polymerase sigma-70 factor (TIGR02960 family)